MLVYDSKQSQVIWGQEEPRSVYKLQTGWIIDPVAIELLRFKHGTTTLQEAYDNIKLTESTKEVG